MGEQFKPELLAVNPQHTVPVYIEDGKILTDSHAISTYLITKYAKDDSLYPSDPFIRAQIDQRLHFDTGVLFPRFLALVLPIASPETVELPASAVEKATESIQWLETYLGDNDYLVDNHLTLADFSCATTALSIICALDMANDRFPKVQAWISRLNQLPYNLEVNELPGSTVRQLVKEKLEANRAAKQ